MSDSITTEAIAEYIKRVVDEAPAPNAEQLERLRALLRPADGGGRP